MTRLDELEQRIATLEQARTAPTAFYDEHGRLFLQFGTTSPLRVPGFVDREVYRPQERYLCGDGVSFGGHYWVARIDGATLPPGSGTEASKHWRMVVRRGKQGERAQPLGRPAKAPEPRQ
jgi:hypothetical protein